MCGVCCWDVQVGKAWLYLSREYQASATDRAHNSQKAEAALFRCAVSILCRTCFSGCKRDKVQLFNCAAVPSFLHGT